MLDPRRSLYVIVGYITRLSCDGSCEKWAIRTLGRVLPHGLEFQASSDLVGFYPMD
jgi:hypothetical protein